MFNHGFLALPSGGLVLKGFIVSGTEWGSLSSVETRLLSPAPRGFTGPPARARAMRGTLPQTSSGEIKRRAPLQRRRASDAPSTSSGKRTHGLTETD
ncbi:hypothetical protein DNTS_025590 [Danionella cerebrum]|uniref:Uncharacterized protein n=1 Tax=Danionella cerebrum TaxID=2873325 RepID=A0A553PYS0_9TELE|nr:hypothetical protein DNTS_025590 [Danionella translucida]